MIPENNNTQNSEVTIQLDRMKEISSLLCRTMEAAERIVNSCLDFANNRNNPAVNNNQLLNSTMINNDTTIRNDQSTSLNSDSSTTSDAVNNTMLNNTLKCLQETIKQINEVKIDINREYKLTNKISFNLWYDFLKSELKSFELFDMIDPAATTSMYLQEEKERRNIKVRDIIINRIHNYYHKQVADITDPKKIIEFLKEYKKIESNTSNSAIRQRLQNIRMHPKEKAAEFINKFESILRDGATNDGADPITSGEKRSYFYHAIKDVVKNLNNLCLLYKLNDSEQKEMGYKELKNTLLSFEAEKTLENESKSRNETKVKANMANAKQFQNKHNIEKCFRCSKYGHLDTVCPLIEKGQFFCYICKKISNHKGKYECRLSANYNPKYDPNLKTNSNNKGERTSKYQKQGGGKASHKSNGRHHPYNRSNNPESRTPKANAASTADASGNLLNYDKYSDNITFIADSGATEHIINKGLILSNFEKSKGKIIKSANKNRKADIRIDGKGNLFLKSNFDSNQNVELTNVIAAKDIANNLLSLRKFADMGLSIYLDNKILKIYDKETNQEYLSGIYEKPNWLLEFTAQTSETSSLDPNYENYSCIAQIVTLDEFLQQSQTDIQDFSRTISEGSNNIQNPDRYPSDLGRENEQELNQEVLDSDLFLDSDFDKNTINRKILNFNEINPEGLSNDMFLNQNLINQNSNIKKISEGMLWHLRLGHASINYLKCLQKYHNELKNVKFEDSIKDCEVCKLAKMTKQPCIEVRTRADNPLQRIHSDMMGRIKPISFPEGNKYIITFIDDFSRYAKIYTIKKKNQAGECLEKFLQHSRNILGENKKVCYIRADNAKEYLYGHFLEIMNREKIDNDFAPAYTPELNGTAERFNLTLKWKIASLLLDSGLPQRMWILAAETSTYIYNRTPHKSDNCITPIEKFAPKQKLHLDKIKRFGCIAYVRIPISETKFSANAIKTVLVGFSNTGYVLWHPPSGKFLCSRHVRFNEKLVYKDEYKNQKIIQNAENDECENIKDLELISFKNPDSESEIENEKDLEKETFTDVDEQDKRKRGRPKKRTAEVNIDEESDIIRKQPNRKAKEGRDFTIYARETVSENLVEDTSFAYFTTSCIDKNKVIFDDDNPDQVSHNLEQDEIRYSLFATINKDPTSYKEAMLSTESLKWKEAIDDEMNSMNENEVWILIDRPLDKKEEKKLNIIDSRWVFTRKTGENGKLKLKARLVIRGFKDKRCYELRETHAPVSRLPLIRAILAIVNKYDLELYQMDVKNAFLNGILDEDIYMEIPEGFEADSEIRKTKICKLQKALYG